MCLLLSLSAPLPCSAAISQVYIIDVHGPVWPGLAEYVDHELDQAWTSGAAGVILDLDTTSGQLSAVEDINKTVAAHNRDLVIACFVHDHATGYGSLIAVASKTIAMTPAALLGGMPDSSSNAELRAAAESSGRNPEIAAAFSGAERPIPSIGVKSSDILTLTTRQATAVGYCDVTAADYSDVLIKMGLPGAETTNLKLDPWTAVALFIVQPWATIVLLAIGLTLILLEVTTWHTAGVAGIIGGLLLAAVFAAHIAVGAASWFGLILFLVGIALIVFEAHLPGHGFAMISGVVLAFIGMFYALGGFSGGALFAMGASAFTCLLLTIAFFMYLPRSPVWKKISQPLRQTAALGYVANDDYTGFIGKSGFSTTLLRPSGTAEIDGIRLSVVSEGEFILPGAAVQVVLVQGSRIVVRELSTTA